LGNKVQCLQILSKVKEIVNGWKGGEGGERVYSYTKIKRKRERRRRELKDMSVVYLCVSVKITYVTLLNLSV